MPAQLACATGQPVLNQELELAFEDGRRIDLVQSVVPLFAADGTVRGAVIAAADVTVHRKLERELRAAVASKDQFIARLSHELRQPLQPVLLSLSGLESDPRLPEDVLEEMVIARRNLDLEVHMVDELLDVARIVHRKMVLARETVDVAEVLRHVGQIVAADLEARGQTLAIDAPSPPYWVEGDRARLHQVFWNLVRNAIKFSVEGGRIEISCQLPPARVASCPLPAPVRVIVRDYGIGIAGEHLPRLFRPFEQEAGETFGGLGLGLAICKGVLDLHGGRISAASEGIGRGATFTVELPLSTREAPAARCGGPDSPPVARLQPAGQSLHVLLVEDHPDSARVLRRLLIAKGYRVTWAASIKDALAAAREGGFDVLISDIGLPDGTGYDLMRQLVADGRGRKLRGIAVTGFGTEDDVERAKAAGFTEHVTKPVSFPALLGALARLADAM